MNDTLQLILDSLQSGALLILAIVMLRMNRTRRPRQTQTGGHGSVQVQSGGTLVIPAELSNTGLEQRIDLTADADADAERLARATARRKGTAL